MTLPKSNKKYTVKLRRTQLTRLFFLYYYLTIILSFIVIFIIDYLFDIAFPKLANTLSIMNYSIDIFLYKNLTLWLLLSTLYLWYRSKLSFSKIQRYKKNFKNIIEDHKFYVLDKNNQISRSITFKFYWKDSYFFIEVYPNGGQYTSQMEELTQIFETAFNMTVVDKFRPSPSHTTYQLSNHVGSSINATDRFKN